MAAEQAALQAVPGVIVVVAKCPIPGKSKTRLIPLLNEQGAARLARAMLADVLYTLSASPELASVKKIMLYAPANPFGLEMMQNVLEEVIQHPSCSKSKHKIRWDLLPMQSQDLSSSNLTVILQDALIRARNLQHPASLKRQLSSFEDDMLDNDDDSSMATKAGTTIGPVLFLGMDAPQVPLDEILAALHHPEQARLCPSADGGYGLVSIPRWAPTSVFAHVRWSHSTTALAQLKALTDHNVPVVLGRLMHDIDEPQDVVNLCHRLLQLSETAVSNGDQQKDCLEYASASALVASKNGSGSSWHAHSSGLTCPFTRRALVHLGQLPEDENHNLSAT